MKIFSVDPPNTETVWQVLPLGNGQSHYSHLQLHRHQWGQLCNSWGLLESQPFFAALIGYSQQLKQPLLACIFQGQFQWMLHCHLNLSGKYHFTPRIASYTEGTLNSLPSAHWATEGSLLCTLVTLYPGLLPQRLSPAVLTYCTRQTLGWEGLGTRLYTLVEIIIKLLYLSWMNH